MKVLFLTIGKLDNIEDRGIYSDLLRCIRDNGHEIYTISPYEKRKKLKTVLVEQNYVHMLHVRIGNITKCNLIEKGISTLLIELQYINAIKSYFKNVKFDLIIYSTPPITLCNAIEYVKKRDNAKTYLLLKDIFPQNAVDIGIMSMNGLKGIIYRYFRKREKKLYAISDRIGCMSHANVEYVLKHNLEVSQNKVEVCPNCIEIQNIRLDICEREKIRDKYGIPKYVKTFVYGGNLGKPQGIDFLIECLKANKNYKDRFFVICGTGTDYKKLENFVNEFQPNNVLLINGLSTFEYEKIVGSCDVGLIFLDHRFTIPNFPSRLLSYMQNSIPVIACTDVNTDIGDVIVNGNFGWWCESNDVESFIKNVETAMKSNLKELGANAFEYLSKNYNIERNYEIIIGNLIL